MPDLFVGRRRGLLVGLAAIGMVQAILTVVVAVLTPTVISQGLGRLAIGLVVAALLIGAARVIERILSEEVGQDYVREIRRLLITSAIVPDKDINLGTTIARATNDLSAVKNWVSLGISPMIVGVPLIAGVTVAMILIEPSIGLTLTTVILAFGITMVMLMKPFFTSAARLRKVRGRMAGMVADTVSAADAIRQTGGVEREVDRVDKHSANVQKAARRRAAVSGTMRGTAASVTTLLAVIIAIAGSQFGVASPTITTGIFLAGILSAPLSDLGRVGEYRQNYRAGKRILLPILDTARKYSARVKRLANENRRMRYRSNPIGLSHGALHVADLYDEHGSFPQLIARPGARILIAGSSLERVDRALAEVLGDDETTTWVTIAGTHMGMMTERQKRSLIGIADREDLIPRGTISRIARYRVPNDDIDVDALLAKVGLDDVVAQLPKGAATELRRGGSPLKPHERGLLKLAEAIAGDPPVLVLKNLDDQLDQRGRRILKEIIAQYPGIVLVRSTNPEAILDEYDVWNVDALFPSEVVALETSALPRPSTVRSGDGTDPFGPPARVSVMDREEPTPTPTEEVMDDEE